MLSPDTHTQANALMQLMEEHSLSQLIDVPTWITCNSQTLIDIILTNSDSLFDSTGAVEFTGNPRLVSEKLSLSMMCNTQPRTLLSSRTLGCNEDFYSIDDMWSYWKTLFWSVVDRHVPMIKAFCNKIKSDPWISGKVRRLIKSCHSHRKLTRSENDWNICNTLRCKVRQSIHFNM